ncbi:hypothetical protein YC2023_066264 [Brassica napus]
MTSVGVRQHTQDVCGSPCVSMCVRMCPSAHTGRLWLFISTHISTLVLGLSMLTLPVDCSGDFGPRGLSVQYTQDVRGCPPGHTGRPWLSVSRHRMSVAVRVCPCVSVNRQRTSLAVHQYTYQHAGPWTQHAGSSHGMFGIHRTSVAVHQYTYTHVGPWTQHAGLSCGLFGTSVAVRVCPWVSVSTHRTSVCVRQQTEDVIGCPSVHIPARWPSVAVRQHTLDVRGCLWLSVSTHRTSVAVRVCPSAYTGRPWLSISTHISTLVLGLSTLALPVDCSGDFGSRGLSVQYTQAVRGFLPAHTERPWLSVSTHRTSVAVRVCPSEYTGLHTGRPWVSVSTHMTSVGVRQHTQDVCGCPCVSVCVRQHTQDVRGCPSVHISARCTHRTSVGVRQHTQDVCGCPSAHTGRPWLSVCVHVCPSTHTGRPWLSISTHISTLVLGVSTLALLVDCSGDFGPRELSVQYTQDVRGSPPAHTRRLWLYVAVRQHTQDVSGCLCVSVCVRQHTQDVRGCPSVHMSARWSLDSACWLFLWTVWVILAHVGCLFSTHRTSVGVRQHTHDVCGCPSAHTGRMWLSVCVHVCPYVSVSTHRTSVAVHQYTYQHYTQDVRGCPPGHTGRPWLSVSRHRMSVAVRVCPCVSVNRQRTSLAVHQYTYQHAGPWTQHAGSSHGMFGIHRTSVAVHQYTYTHVGPWTQHAGLSCGLFGTSVAVRVCPWVSVSTHRTSVCVRQQTEDVIGCPSVHIPARWPSVAVRQHTLDVRGCLWLSVSTHRTSVAVRVCPSAYTGRPWLSISTHISTLVLGLSTLALPVDCSGDFGSRGLSVQYTQAVRGFLPAHTERPWLSVSTHRTSVAVRVCPSEYTGLHTGRPWVSVSTHMTSVGVRQHTQDVCGCPCVSVCVRQHTQDVRGCPSVHISARCTHRTSVGVRQHTQDVCGCPSAHTGRPWLSVCVHVCPSTHTGRPWLSISTHISTLVLGVSTLALLVDCSGDFGPRELSVQYTQDVRGSPPAHTRRLWLYVAVRQHTQDVSGCLCVSVCVRQHTQDVRGCPSVHMSARWSLDSACWLFLWTVWVILAHVGCLFSTHRTSVGVRQHTHDVCGCPSAHTGRMWLSVCVHVCPYVSVSTHRTSVAVHQYTYQHVGPWTHTHRTSVGVRQDTQDVRGCPSADTGCPWLSVCVRVCPSTDRGRHWLSISTHISTLVLGLSTLALPMDCSGDFGPRELSVQYTQDVCGRPPAHTRRLWLYVAVRRHTQDVSGCLCVSVCVRQHTQDVRGCPSVHMSARWSLDSACWPFLWTVWVILAHMGCLFSTHRTSVGVRQHTHDVCGCPSVHTGRMWLSVCVHVCPYVSVSTHRTSVAVHQYTYQHVGPWTHTHRTSVGVRQDTQDVRGCPSADTGCPWLSVCVRVCPSTDRGRHWLSISTHISTLVLGLSTLALPMDCSGDFGPRELFVQYTQAVRGCPPAHTGHPWLSVCVHQNTQDVRRCPSIHISARWSLDSARWPFLWTVRVILAHVGCRFSTHRTSVGVRQHTHDVCGCPSAHTGRLWLFVCVRGCPSAHTGRPCVPVNRQRTSLAVHHTHRPSVAVRQHTLDVRGCLWLSVSTHRTSVAVRVCPSAYTGRPWLSISTHISTLVLGLSTLALPVDCSGDFGSRGLSVQYTQAVRGFLPAHTERPWLSVAVRQHTQDIRGCPCVSIRIHRTSVAVHQYTYQHVGPWTQHAGLSCGLFGTSVAVRVCPCVSVRTHRTSVAVHHTHRTSVGVRQHTQDVCGCPSAHTGRPWLSVCVHVCPSTHTGRPWLSISTHISTLVLGLSTLALLVDCSGDFGPRELSVQYTQDVRGSPPAHTRRLWLYVAVRQHTQDVSGCLCVSVCVRQHTQDVRGCPSVHISARWSLDSACWPFLWTVWVILAHVGCLFSTHRTSVGVRQHTHDVCGCPSAHTGRMWLSVCVHVCPYVSVRTHRTSVAVHQYTYQHVGPWTQYADPSRGLFGTSVAVRQQTQDVRGCPCVSVCVRQQTEDVIGCPSVHISARWPSVGVRQHTLDVRGCLWVSVSRHRTSVAVRVCPSAYTGRPWLSISTHISTLVLGLSTLALPVDCSGRLWVSVSTHRTSVSVRVCPCVSVSAHRTSVAVHRYTYQHVAPWTQHTDPSRGLFGTLVLGLSTRTLPVDCSGDFGPRGLSVQYTQDVRGCPPSHTGRLWLSVAVRQHTHDICGCPCVSVSTHRTSVAVHHTHRTSVGVRQHTQDIRVCPSVPTGRLWLSVAVRQHTQDICGCPCVSVSTHRTSVCVRQYTQDVRGCPCVSVSTHRTSVAVHQYTYQHYTQDVRRCPPAHTGRPCVSVAVRQHTQDVRGCPCVSVSTHRTSVAVHQYTYQHAGPWTQHAGPFRGLFG